MCHFWIWVLFLKWVDVLFVFKIGVGLWVDTNLLFDVFY